jgi:stress-induced morphogen
VSNADLVKRKIEHGLSGCTVIVHDPRKDDVHLKAEVHWEGFKGMTLIEQHRAVYATLKEELKETLHALGIETHEK